MLFNLVRIGSCCAEPGISVEGMTTIPGTPVEFPLPTLPHPQASALACPEHASTAL